MSTCDWIHQLMMRFAWGTAVYPVGAVIKIKALCELTCSNLLRCDCNSNRQIFERRGLRSKAASCCCCWARAFLCEGTPHPPTANCIFLLYCIFCLACEIGFSTLEKEKSEIFRSGGRQQKWMRRRRSQERLSSDVLMEDGRWVTDQRCIITPSKCLGLWSVFIHSDATQHGVCSHPAHLMTSVLVCSSKYEGKQPVLSWLFWRSLFSFFLELLSDLVQDRKWWYKTYVPPEWFMTRRPPFTVHMWDLCDYV